MKYKMDDLGMNTCCVAMIERLLRNVPGPSIKEMIYTFGRNVEMFSLDIQARIWVYAFKRGLDEFNGLTPGYFEALDVCKKNVGLEKILTSEEAMHAQISGKSISFQKIQKRPGVYRLATTSALEQNTSAAIVVMNDGSILYCNNDYVFHGGYECKEAWPTNLDVPDRVIP